MVKYFWLFFTILLFFPNDSSALTPSQRIEKYVGASDAVLLASPYGKIVLGINTDKKLTPASTLKILTSLAAIHCLGEDFRFYTDFYIDAKSNLIIKGYGDPLLISEVIQKLVPSILKNQKIINNIILDDTYFDKPITIPGTRSASAQPYDAPNGALCVNFNTVNFKRDNGTYVSAESQTPLLEIAKKYITRSSGSSGRIMFTHNKNEATLYAGEMFKYFIDLSGGTIKGKITLGKVSPMSDHLLYRHKSEFKLTDVIAKLLQYSNNYIANQIFLTIGANVFGPPATLKKATGAVCQYAETELGIKDIELVEGSGISRQNRISAATFLKILSGFKSYHGLMQYENGEYYKTGTLNGIRTRAGYLESSSGDLFPFIVMLNTPGKATEPVIDQLKKLIN